MKMRASRTLPTILVLFAFLLTGCSRRPSSAATLRVFAASSLTEVFGELEQRFEARYPGTDVELTFAGSQILRLQIEQGAAADVFASADAQHIQALESAGMVHDSRVFAYNELVVIVPENNPANIHSLSDLPNAKRLVIGSENVPVGRYTVELLERAGRKHPQLPERVRQAVISRESNVRLVRAKVELGEADAAIVYRTDATGSNAVRTIEVDSSLNVRASYYLGATQRASDRGAAQKFVDFVSSAEGRGVLERHGFTGGP